MHAAFGCPRTPPAGPASQAVLASVARPAWPDQPGPTSLARPARPGQCGSTSPTRVLPAARPGSRSHRGWPSPLSRVPCSTLPGISTTLTRWTGTARASRGGPSWPCSPITSPAGRLATSCPPTPTGTLACSPGWPLPWITPRTVGSCSGWGGLARGRDERLRHAVRSGARPAAGARGRPAGHPRPVRAGGRCVARSGRWIERRGRLGQRDRRCWRGRRGRRRCSGLPALACPEPPAAADAGRTVDLARDAGRAGRDAARRHPRRWLELLGRPRGGVRRQAPRARPRVRDGRARSARRSRSRSSAARPPARSARRRSSTAATPATAARSPARAAITGCSTSTRGVVRRGSACSPTRWRFPCTTSSALESGRGRRAPAPPRLTGGEMEARHLTQTRTRQWRSAPGRPISPVRSRAGWCALATRPSSSLGSGSRCTATAIDGVRARGLAWSR